MSALKHFRPFWIVLLLVFLLAACSGNGGQEVSPTPAAPTETPLPPTDTPIPPAALVNGEPISRDEFNAEVERYQASQAALGTTSSAEEIKRVVLDDLVAQVLLAQGAAESGFAVDETLLQTRIEALTTQIGGAEALTAWQQAHGYTETGFRAALRRSIAAAWMRDKIISSVPNTAQQVHVRQILLYNEEVAQSYYNQIQAGAKFEELAILVDPITRGDLGWFPRGYLTSKEIEEAAFSQEVGAISQIIKSEAGYHILTVLEIQADRPLSPDARLALQNRALINWLANRRQQSDITTNVN